MCGNNSFLDGKDLLISMGDLTDRMTILELKFENSKDTKSDEVVREDLIRTDRLIDRVLDSIETKDFERVLEEWNTLVAELQEVNRVQWNLEDRVRKETNGEAARLARENNNKRVVIKNKINILFNYPAEIKDYK